MSETYLIPAGESCDDCPFRLLDNDSTVTIDQCVLYGDWWSEGDLKRCPNCLTDHPNGATVTIDSKAQP